MKIGMDSNICTGSSPSLPRSKRGPGYKVFFVYILQSKPTGRYYIGYSDYPDRRLLEHNGGKVKSTRPYRPWVKLYQETFPTKILAIRRERELKAKKSRNYLGWLTGKTRPDEYRDG